MVPRVRALPVLLLTALLIVPSVAAFVSGDPLRSAPGDVVAGEGMNAEGITWFGPERVQVGHPVFAAVAVLSGSGFATGMHQNLEVWATLNDNVIFHTASIHEHHGLHAFTVTPMQPGTLRLYAAEPGAAHDHLLGDLERLGTPPAPHGAMHEVQVEGAALALSDLVRLDATAMRDGETWQVTSSAKDTPFAALITLEDDAGRLLASSWASARDGTAQQGSISPAAAALDIILTPHPSAQETPYADRLRHTDNQDGQGVTIVAPATPDLPLCDDGDRRLVLDPDSLVAALPTWQEWSDVRVHLLDTARLAEADPAPLLYTIAPLALRAGEGSLYTLEASDPFAYASFRMTQPGLHFLLVQDSASMEVLCSTLFLVTPGPGGLAPDGPGELEVAIQEFRGGARIDLASRLPDGGELPHYEFDTRVVRVADDDGPGFLAWRGKLHGHAGEVSFHVTNLAPGTYEMRVYPSPQDSELRPLAAGPDGFVYTFTVAGDDVFFNEIVEEFMIPAPGIAILLLALLAPLARYRKARR